MSISTLAPLATVVLGGMIAVSLAEDRAKSRGSVSKTFRLLAVALTLTFLGLLIAGHISLDRVRFEGTGSWFWGLWLWLLTLILAGFNWLRSRGEPESEKSQSRWVGSPLLYFLFLGVVFIVVMILND